MNLSVALLVLLAAQDPGEGVPAGREKATVKFGRGEKVALTCIKPAGYDKSRKFPVVFALPPGDGSATMVDTALRVYWEREAGRRGYIVISPEILAPSLETKARPFISAVFAWMDKNLSYDKDRVVLAGVSAGGVGMFFAAAACPERFCGLLGLPAIRHGGQPKDLRPLKGKPVWLLIGAKDGWKGQAEETAKALKDAGAKATLEIVEGQGHNLQVDAARLFDWMDGLKPAK